jgi:Flp pilus assembly protein TadG
MLRRIVPVQHRRGTATVELALVLNLLVIPLMLGLWEMGRFVQVQQIVSNSAREGARMAAQALTIQGNGAPVEIRTMSTTAPSVKSAVMQYLVGAGLTRLTYSDVDVTFAFLPPDATNDPPLTNPIAGATQPFQGVQGQRFRVTVTINDFDSSNNEKPIGSRPMTEKVLWTTLGLVKPRAVSYEVDWVMLVDKPFTINTTMPGW